MCGAALLAVTYLLVSHQITGGRGIENPPSPAVAAATVKAPPSGGRHAPVAAPNLKMPTVPPAVLHIMQSSAGQEFLRLAETQQQVTRAAPARDRVRGRARRSWRSSRRLLGWVVAGRVLRPLRTITATDATRSRSTNLHRRLDLPGPRDELRTAGGHDRRRCSRVWRRRSSLSGGSSPTPRTSCAPHWPRCAPHWTWRIAKPHAVVAAAGQGAGCEPARGPRPSRSPARELPGARARAARRARRGDIGVARAGRRRRTRQPRRGDRRQADRASQHRSARVRVTGSRDAAGEDGRQLDRQRRATQPAAAVSSTSTCEADRDTARLVVESGGPVLDQGGRRAARRAVQATRGRAHRLAERPRPRALDRRCDRRRARRRAQALRPRARRARGRDHPASRSRRATRDRTGMRVLVVEDAPRLANWIAEGLRDQGIAVDIAYDGHEAASKLNLNPYDVVVLDRDLPGIHGDTLCQMITESDEPAMILMLTAAGCARRAGRRARARRRRLPAQTLPLPRTRAARPRARPPQARQPTARRCEQPESSSTRPPAPSLETDARSR